MSGRRAAIAQASARVSLGLAWWVGAMWGAACSTGTGGSGAQPVGMACTTSPQCYAGIDAGALKGQVTCLTQLQNGYCTHTCASDTDCCSVPGECPAGLKETCASFESSGQTYCFLACDTASLASDPDAATTDPTTFCHDWANPTFTCRSTGGGSANQRFCGP